MKILQYRKLILIAFALLTLGSLFTIPHLQFVFDFERFFPRGDEDLEFFYEFREQFEDDDNFLLIGLEDETSVFQPKLLMQIDSLTKAARKIPHIQGTYSLTNFEYFVKLRFGGFSPPFPAIHLDDFSKLSSDSTRVMQDERLVNTFISEDAKHTIVLLKTTDALEQNASIELMDSLTIVMADIGIEDYRLLGRASFQTGLIDQQMIEFVFSTVVAALLVLIVFFIVFRKPIGILIALTSILVCLLVFLGALSVFQVPLDMLSPLFPIIMIIVGVSDVVHLMSKYIDELQKGETKKAAILATFKEIGLATFLTSFTTAIGFVTLVTSRIPPVRNFGLAAAMGVLLAYGITILFTTAFLSFFPAEKIYQQKKSGSFWKKYLERVYQWGRENPKIQILGLIAYIAFTCSGISLVTTDVKMYDTLPQDIKVTDDFVYFEENFVGFRPYEIAAMTKEGHFITDYDVLQEINKVESFIAEFEEINTVSSVTTLYKTLNRASNGDQASFYTFPDENSFKKVQSSLESMPMESHLVFTNEENTAARISGKIRDVGAYKVHEINQAVKDFIAENVNADLVEFRITGTGVIIDKNNEYLRSSLLYGLAIAFVIIGIVMGLLFKDVKMVFISLVPNFFPLLFGGALMGYLGIALDAPTAIIFAISFGIAVDDTIHFLSKFKIERNKGQSIEAALQATVVETGKAIILTSIILFFGFLILLFSKTPSVFYVGILISGTLLTAVVADLTLIPLMIRFFYKES